MTAGGGLDDRCTKKEERDKQQETEMGMVMEVERECYFRVESGSHLLIAMSPRLNYNNQTPT